MLLSWLSFLHDICLRNPKNYGDNADQTLIIESTSQQISRLLVDSIFRLIMTGRLECLNSKSFKVIQKDGFGFWITVSDG